MMLSSHIRCQILFGKTCHNLLVRHPTKVPIVDESESESKSESKIESKSESKSKSQHCYLKYLLNL